MNIRTATKITTFKIIVVVVLVIGLFLIEDRSIFMLLKKGIDRYYGLGKDAQVLLIGHSHTVLGIDAPKLEQALRVPVAKYATAGANVLDRYYMVRQFVEENPQVKTVVYDIEPRLFDSEGLSSASYLLFLPYIDNSSMAQFLEQEADWQEYYACRLIKTTRFRDQTLLIALRGLLGKIENAKSSTVRIEDYQKYFEREKERKIRINPESVRYFRKTLEYLIERDITVVLNFIPVIDLLNEVDPIAQEQALLVFKEAAASSPHVHYLDMNVRYQHNHELFYDLRHLNYKGKKKVTADLAGYLVRIGKAGVTD